MPRGTPIVLWPESRSSPHGPVSSPARGVEDLALSFFLVEIEVTGDEIVNPHRPYTGVPFPPGAGGGEVEDRKLLQLMSRSLTPPHRPSGDGTIRPGVGGGEVETENFLS